MARKSSLPDEITRYKPCKSTRIRNDNGIYRVYKYGSMKLSSGKWSSDYGYLIGKIIPGEGFLPNKRYLKELSEANQNAFSDVITDVAYGNYALLIHLSGDVIEKLNKCFVPEKAAQIYCYALILCANGFVHIDQVDDFFQESLLSLKYQGYSFKMGQAAVAGLLRDLGSRGKPVRQFEQNLIDECSKNVAIDGHVIRSCSTENDLAEAGYKMGLLKAPQVNVLIAYDIRNKVPLVYRTFRGSSVDKKSVLELLESRSFKETKFLVDRGFFSKEVLKKMSENGNCYTIPLAESNARVKRIKKTLQYTSGEFVYKPGKKASARVVYYEEWIDSGTRIIAYKDMDENNSKRKSYKQHIDEGDASYTQENYEKYCDWWGVYFLQTTTRDDAAAVYGDYKDRWSIETYNNYIKNDAGFNDLKIQDYYVQHGFDFIMLVTGLIHSRLNDAVVKLKKTSISTFDVLVKAGHLRMVLEESEWRIHNTRTRDLDLLKELGFIPETVISCI